MQPEQQEVLHSWGRLESFEYIGGSGRSYFQNVCWGLIQVLQGIGCFKAVGGDESKNMDLCHS